MSISRRFGTKDVVGLEELFALYPSCLLSYQLMNREIWAVNKTELEALALHM